MASESNKFILEVVDRTEPQGGAGSSPQGGPAGSTTPPAYPAPPPLPSSSGPSGESVTPLSSPAVVVIPPPPALQVPETASTKPPTMTDEFFAKKQAREAAYQAAITGQPAPPPKTEPSVAATEPVSPLSTPPVVVLPAPPTPSAPEPLEKQANEPEYQPAVTGQPLPTPKSETGAKEGDTWTWRGDTLVSGPGGAGGQPPGGPPSTGAATASGAGGQPPGWGAGILGDMGNQQLAITAATVHLTGQVVNWAGAGPSGGAGAGTPGGGGAAPTGGPTPSPFGPGSMNMAALAGSSASSPLGSTGGGSAPPVPMTGSASPAPTPAPTGAMDMAALAAHSQGPQADPSKTAQAFRGGLATAKKVVTKGFSIASKSVRPVATVATDLAGNQNLKALSDTASAVATGMMAVGGSLGPFGVALMAGTAAVGAFNQVVNAFIQRGQELSKYSGDLSVAFARSEVRQTRSDIREAQELGPDIARMVEAQSQMSEGFQELLLPIKKFLVEYLAATMEVIVEFLRDAKSAAKALPDFVAFIQGATAAMGWLERLNAANWQEMMRQGINLFLAKKKEFDDAEKAKDDIDFAAFFRDFANPVQARPGNVPLPVNRAFVMP